MTGWFFTRIALAALFGVVVGAAIAVRMERNGKERNGGRSGYTGPIPTRAASRSLFWPSGC